jgi:hypothetical protein
MQIDSDDTMIRELEQWGWWAQNCPSRSLNYPRKSNFKTVKSTVKLDITDDRALEIDVAIAKIFGRDEKAMKLIKLKFVCGFSYRDIAKHLEISASGAQKMIDSHVHWLTGYFYGRSEKAS